MLILKMQAFYMQNFMMDAACQVGMQHNIIAITVKSSEFNSECDQMNIDNSKNKITKRTLDPNSRKRNSPNQEY